MKKSENNLLFDGKPSKPETEINQHEIKDTSFFFMILNERSIFTINLSKLDTPFDS